MNRNLVPALIATLSLAATAAWAQTSAVPATATTTTNATVKQPMVVTRLETTFSAFAGSTDNAESLIMGLRNGTPVTLTDSSGNTSTFTPATKKMGWGNVKIALALAQAQLTKAGITNPTSADIQTALNGGTITNSDGTTTKMTGILTQRASGMGWGQIAQVGGTKLGPVVSGLHKTNATTTTTAPATGAAASTGIVTASGSSAVATASHGKASNTVVTTASGSTTAASTSGAAHAATVSASGAHTNPAGITTGQGSNTGAAHGKGHHGG